MSSPIEDHVPLAPFTIRPRFETTSSASVEDLSNCFLASLNREGATCEGKVRIGYLSLFPKSEDQHYWSPHLSVVIEESEDDKEVTSIRGLYGPRPTVWTMFIFFYTIVASMILIATIIGFANRSIGNSGAVLWAVPFLIILLCSIYFVSYFGQKKGHDQVETLHRFIESCVGHEII